MMVNRRYGMLLVSGIVFCIQAENQVSQASGVAKDAQIAMEKQGNAKDSDLKVCYVDYVSAMRESKAGQQVTFDIEAKRKKMATELQELEKIFAYAVKEFQDKAVTMSDEAREKEQTRIAKMERDFKIRAQEYEEELKREMQRATEKLSKEFEEAVAEYARAEKLDVVVDKVTGRVIYSVVDQAPTMRVVTIMDRNHTKHISTESSKKQPTTVAKAKTDKQVLG
jgi:Skp family chaperone for outer membrane proteins